MEKNYQFWLSYNPKTGDFLIDGTNQNLDTLPNESDFKRVGGSNDFVDLRLFAKMCKAFMVGFNLSFDNVCVVWNSFTRPVLIRGFCYTEL